MGRNIEIELRRVIPAQWEEVIEMARKIWIPTFAPLFSKDELTSLFSGMYNQEKLTVWLQSAPNRMDFIYLGTEALGYCATEERAEAFWLDKIYIDPVFQGRGLGSATLDKLIDRAKAASNIKIALRVNRRNKAAIDFYLYKGFRIDGEMDIEGPNGFVYDDYLMSKML